MSTREIAPDIYADFEQQGRFLGVEVLNASAYYDKATLEQLDSGAGYLTLPEAAAEAGLDPSTGRQPRQLFKLSLLFV